MTNWLRIMTNLRPRCVGRGPPDKEQATTRLVSSTGATTASLHFSFHFQPASPHKAYTEEGQGLERVRFF